MLNRSWSDAEPELIRCWPEADSKVNRSWSDGEPKLIRWWTEADSMVNRSWFEAELNLIWCWIEADPMVIQRWTYPDLWINPGLYDKCWTENKPNLTRCWTEADSNVNRTWSEAQPNLIRCWTRVRVRVRINTKCNNGLCNTCFWLIGSALLNTNWMGQCLFLKFLCLREAKKNVCVLFKW
jgi:hypothetical protein